MMEPQQWDRRHDALGNFHTLPDDVVCRILSLLSSRDIGNLTCVSSVFYILCNEEPLWMQLCLQKHEGLLDYKYTWKQTALAKLPCTKESTLHSRPLQQFQGFSSVFLYQRWYRCHVALEHFALDNGAIERRSGVLAPEFSASYDGKRPVLLTDLMDDWPAMKCWRLDQLVKQWGDAEFKVSHPHGSSVRMKLKDFAGYMEVQHDEEPLYIFDPQFGESVPELLKDYKVPTLFSDDLFSVLNESQRPPYRWLVLGPARSGASWHVDPSLTSAWNSLISGRKRWALYPPGKVPPGVILDVDEDDGSIHFDGPNSLQWWLDVYPLLEENDKPLECTQLPGETIYVPSGWWHCVLNIDASVAVTQNFVNANNLVIVCMDLAPGYRHRAIARAGMVALEGNILSQRSETVKRAARQADPIIRGGQTGSPPSSESKLGTDKSLKKKLSKFPSEQEDPILTMGLKSVGGVTDQNLLLALDALKIHSEEKQSSEGQLKKGHKNVGESVMREWLRKLWVARPELQEIIWKGACLTLDAGTWLYRINIICNALGFPTPTDEDQLPVDGSNLVYLVGDYVIKLYIQEAGPVASIDGLGSELEFYALLKESGSAFQDVVPEFVAGGIVYPDGEDYRAVPWDGTGDCSLVYTRDISVGRKRHRDSAKTSKGRFRTKWSSNSVNSQKDDEDPAAQDVKLWPYLVTKRCRGRSLSEVRENMTEGDLQSLATFLGKQVGILHSLPLPAVEQSAWDYDCRDRSDLIDTIFEEPLQGRDLKEARWDSQSTFIKESVGQSLVVSSRALITTAVGGQSEPAAAVGFCEIREGWQPFVAFLREQRKIVYERLREWGALPDYLLKKVDSYLPKDPVVLIGDLQVHNGVADVLARPVWLHMDLMTDNILVEQCNESTVNYVRNTVDCTSNKTEPELLLCQEDPTIRARYILDYGDLLHGDPLYELVSMHLDIFNLNEGLLKIFLSNYQLPFSSNLHQTGARQIRGVEGAGIGPQLKLSYCAMCYCLLHELDTMEIIFKLRQDIREIKSFEEMELRIWGALNEYVPVNNCR